MNSGHVILGKGQVSRRRFLKLAGASGALAFPTLLGYCLVREAKGTLPSTASPYASAKVMQDWPSGSEAASPILLLISERSENPFGLYLAEILRAEGLCCFQVAHLANLASAALERFDVLLLTEGPLSSDQVGLLKAYVTRGGRLMAMRPDVRLASVLGAERAIGSTHEGYLRADVSHPAGRGIAAETLQFHGTADHWHLAGAQAVAWLCGSDGSRTGFPAVALHRYGQGQAAMWAFDLARSVAYTRQGNPDWADQERDGLKGVRVTDMFEGWADLDRLAIPQADEQQRLLANLLTAMSQNAKPIPRLWYFPGSAKSMLIATGDAHGNPASAIEQVLARVEQRGGHMSIYYATYPSSDLRRAAKRAVYPMVKMPLVGGVVADQLSSPTPAQVAGWRGRGHEFGLHPYVEEGLETGWRRYWQEFTGAGFGPVPPTVRTHRVLWTGWTETARTQAAYGMGMNLDYYHLGPAFRRENGKWAYGHFTGSGLPIKFVDQEGRILNIYQQATQLVDEHLLSLPWVSGEVPRLAAERAVEVSRTLLRCSLDGVHSAIAAQFHVDPFALGGQAAADEARWLEGTLDYAAEQSIPIWSALEWLRFVDLRHDAELASLQWHPAQQQLSFYLVAGAVPDITLTVMVPLCHGNARLDRVEVDGVPAEHPVQMVGGVSYGSLATSAGSHHIVAGYMSST